MFLGGLFGREGGAWTLLFLYPLIWPLSRLVEPVRRSVSDGVVVAFYVIAGTIWMGLLGKLVSVLFTHLFCRRQGNPAA